jgi:Na+-driven multidrug efflux pump
MDSLNLVFIGHLDDPAKLSAMGLGTIIINMGAIGVFVGLNSALEALVS